MNLLIVLGALVFLMLVAYRGYSVILFAPVAALGAVLLTDPALVAAYVACKQAAIALGITDPIAYTQAKRPFIQTAMDRH